MNIDIEHQIIQLEKENEKLKRVLNGTNDGWWHWDLQNDYLEYSDRWWSMLGYETNELPNDSGLWKRLMHQEDYSRVTNFFSEAIKSKTENYEVEFRLLHKEKYYLPVLSKGYIFRGLDGEALTVSGSNIYLTKQKSLESELILAKEKAEESDQLKTAFLQNMSHEIRTPMNAIIGFCNLLNDELLIAEKRKQFTTIIINSANQLLSIVTDILTISAIETKQEKVNTRETNVNNILNNLYAILNPQATSKNISLNISHKLPDSDSIIQTDETKLIQILTNLLTNAMKFTHQGGIEYGYDIENNELEFFVKDTGIGISKENQEKIFERFRQADKTIQYTYGGTGLGLSISKGFVDLLGGRIWVESESNCGTTFHFTIPYLPTKEVNAKEVNYSKLPTYNILVAEDEYYNFLLIEEILKKLGASIIHARDGKETVEIFKASSSIDLILMDIKMPVMNGNEAAEKIKSINAEIPIIAQSAYASENERIGFANLFSDYIMKPIDENELKQKVLKYICKN